FASPLMSVTKYEWLLRNHGAGEPRDRLRLGTVDTWLADRMSGGAVHATDHSNASCTGLYDWMEGRYDDRPLRVLGIEPLWLPAIGSSSGLIGETSRAAFGAEIPIASLAGDQHAAMYGLACLARGSVKLSLGTSGMVTLNAGTALSAPGPGAYP